MINPLSSTIPLGFSSHESEGKYHLHQGTGRSDDGNRVEETDSRDSMSSIINCMIAGGLGGMVGDTSMHSLDTVKTRQQGLQNTTKYRNMITAYSTILKEEGFFRGLYGGYSPAILGSLPLTAAFFGVYEYSKRTMIYDFHINETFSYFMAGIFGDLASSIFYVPLEVLKTRLQLQGRHNNPYTLGISGYNYKSLRNAIGTIAKIEGPGTFVYGYKETLIRDLPFSALQFAFYEKFRELAILYNGNNDLSIPLELLTGASAGGLAGTLTTPLDVIKTRVQTSFAGGAGSATIKALASIYTKEGVVGLFSGVGPRFVWTGIQSSIMLLLYQVSLKKLDEYFPNGMTA